eukprot:Tbor_TRINITY_DN5217_c0_g1::TRINITY_DN5217_c0_g1_i2::g.16200::m.16200/K00826/E2.6.1.42, ilvE; branched-chain amino acid aminotransferase
MMSQIPKHVIRLAAKDIERSSFIIGAGNVLSVMDLKNEALMLKPATSAEAEEEQPLIYEVFRQKGKHRIIYFEEHMKRFREGILKVYQPKLGLGVGDKEVVPGLLGNCEKAVKALAATLTSDDFTSPQLSSDSDEPFQQNIKIVAWEPSPSSFICYYIKSTYPPEKAYMEGIRMGLLFRASRDNPNAKVVQSDLRARANANQNDLNAFECLLVHGPEDNFLVPEGSRSNIVILDKDGRLISSKDSDILVGITLLKVKEQCQRLCIPLLVREITLDDVLGASAVAMLGTSVGVLPVQRLVAHREDIENTYRDDIPVHYRGVIDKEYSMANSNCFVVDQSPGIVAIEKNSQNNDVIQLLIKAYRENL